MEYRKDTDSSEKPGDSLSEKMELAKKYLQEIPIFSEHKNDPYCSTLIESAALGMLQLSQAGGLIFNPESRKD